MNTSDPLSTFGKNLRIAIVGATGGIGSAFVDLLSQAPKVNQILAYARAHPDTDPYPRDDKKVSRLSLDICSEQQLHEQFSALKAQPLDLVIVCTGLLHTEHQQPEKSMRSLSLAQLETVFRVNTFGPALVAKYCLPHLNTERKSIFAVLSARVGSISDNQLGGWYGYRGSKAALNMMLKTLAIETSRKNKQACVVGLHPGTVDTALSKPFQRQVPTQQLFTPTQSAAYLVDVINHLNHSDTGHVFAWDGQQIPP